MLIALMAVTLFSCKSNTETATTAAETPASSCVKEGPEIDMMKKHTVLVTGQSSQHFLATVQFPTTMEIPLQ